MIDEQPIDPLLSLAVLLHDAEVAAQGGAATVPERLVQHRPLFEALRQCLNTMQLHEDMVAGLVADVQRVTGERDTLARTAADIDRFLQGVASQDQITDAVRGLFDTIHVRLVLDEDGHNRWCWTIRDAQAFHQAIERLRAAVPEATHAHNASRTLWTQ